MSNQGDTGKFLERRHLSKYGSDIKSSENRLALKLKNEMSLFSETFGLEPWLPRYYRLLLVLLYFFLHTTSVLYFVLTNYEYEKLDKDNSVELAARKAQYGIF